MSSTDCTKPFSSLEDKLGYRFHDHVVLEEALTHKSAKMASGEADDRVGFYQRLEFLGDAVLGLFIAEELFRIYPQADEGKMTQWRSSLVNRTFLANLATKCAVSEQMIVGPDQQKVRKNLNVLADMMESIIAAVYMDGGWIKCQEVLHRLFDEHIKKVPSSTTIKDPKSVLQEELQSRKWPLPDYSIALRTGPMHNPSFVVQIKLPSFHSRREAPIFSAFGEGVTRKAAEREAAEKTLAYLHSVDFELG